MGALYVTSVESYSGKTAMSLALAKKVLSLGKRVAYLKPVSTQPWSALRWRLRSRSRSRPSCSG